MPDGGIIFSEEAEERIANAVEYVERIAPAERRNRPTRRRSHHAMVFNPVRVSGNQDAGTGWFPGFLQFQNDDTTYTDLEACWVKGANGEGLQAQNYSKGRFAKVHTDGLALYIVDLGGGAGACCCCDPPKPAGVTTGGGVVTTPPTSIMGIPSGGGTSSMTGTWPPMDGGGTSSMTTTGGIVPPDTLPPSTQRICQYQWSPGANGGQGGYVQNCFDYSRARPGGGGIDTPLGTAGGQPRPLGGYLGENGPMRGRSGLLSIYGVDNPGTAGQFLVSNGAGIAPSYQTPGGAPDLTGTVSTTDATVTTLFSWAPTASTTYMFEARVTARRTGGSAGTADDGATYIKQVMVTTKGGTVTLGVQTLAYQSEDQAAWDCIIDVSAGNVRVRVTGAVNNNIDWKAAVFLRSVA